MSCQRFAINEVNDCALFSDYISIYYIPTYIDLSILYSLQKILFYWTHFSMHQNCFRITSELHQIHVIEEWHIIEVGITRFESSGKSHRWELPEVGITRGGNNQSGNYQYQYIIYTQLDQKL